MATRGEIDMVAKLLHCVSMGYIAWRPLLTGHPVISDIWRLGIHICTVWSNLAFSAINDGYFLCVFFKHNDGKYIGLFSLIEWQSAYIQRIDWHTIDHINLRLFGCWVSQLWWHLRGSKHLTNIMTWLWCIALASIMSFLFSTDSSLVTFLLLF